MHLPSHCGTKNVISPKRGIQFLMCLNSNHQCISALETCRRHVPTLWRYRFEKFDTTSYQEIILSLGFFRRETASGFYPWGNVVSPRKRVAEGLCGCRHGNSFPMTRSAQSLRQMRSISHCSNIFHLSLKTHQKLKNQK